MIEYLHLEVKSPHRCHGFSNELRAACANTRRPMPTRSRLFLPRKQIRVRANAPHHVTRVVSPLDELEAAKYSTSAACVVGRSTPTTIRPWDRHPPCWCRPRWCICRCRRLSIPPRRHCCCPPHYLRCRRPRCNPKGG